MLSNNVSNFGLKAQLTVTICTCASYVILLLEFIANCLVDGAFSTPIDSTCKAMPLVNGATTTSSSLIGKFKSKEWLRTFVNKVKFTLCSIVHMQQCALFVLILQIQSVLPILLQYQISKR